MATVTLKGNTINTIGDLPAVGSAAPDFSLVAADLSDKSLGDYAGKIKVISIVPSLDTGVCATSTKVFNEKMNQYDNAVVLVVSADLPFAMSRFCETEKTENVTPLSMMRGKNFAKDYGVLMTDGPLAGIAARAVVVLDETNTVIHTELVAEITQEPNYGAVLEKLA